MRRTRASRAGPVRTHDQQRFLSACVIALGVFVAFILVMFLQIGSLGARTDVVKVTLLALAAGITVGCWRTARRAPGYNRRVWQLFTFTGGVWTLAQGQSFLEPRAATASGPAAILSLLALVPAVWALTTIPPEHRVRAERVRMWLGAGIVLSSAVLLVITGLLNVARPVDVPVVGMMVLETFFPLAHLALACIVWIVLLRVGSAGRLPLFLVASALIVYAFSNVYAGYFGSTGQSFSFEVRDAGRAWCFLLFILAAASPHATNPRQPPTKIAKARYVGLQSLLVYVPVLCSCILVNVVPHRPNVTVVISALLVLVLFGVRLMLLSIDNSRLRDDLEGRVDDLTQRSSELRRLGLQNERIVQSVVDGVIGVDAQGVIAFANPAAAEMLGFARGDLMGRKEQELFHGDPATSSRPVDDCCVVRTALTSGVASVSATESFLAADGHVFPVDLAVGPILEDGLITGAVVVFRDVSERRKIEKMKNEFVSVVSHELRTPLTSIRGSLGLLAGGAGGRLSSMAERMVAVALESSERLTRLINDMLDIERIESGTMPVQLLDCHPRDLIEQALNAIRGISSNHRIDVGTAPGLPLVRADADRIVQTLTNLIGNAIKFSPRATTITVSATRSGDGVEFAVADQGRGIPADKLERIFERFEQVDSSDSREMGGTGLGLAISRTIVHRHGGELTVTSQLQQGSTFRFTLPATAESADAPRPGRNTAPVAAVASPPAHVPPPAQKEPASADGRW